MQISNRIFIVGCPRSGTTLLQSMLASHSTIVSYPESHYFTKMKLHQSKLDRLLGLASKWSQQRKKEFLTEIERPDLWPECATSRRTMAHSTAKFVAILDKLAIEQNASVWIEKTPDNVFVIDTIQQLVPKAKFIHIVREGADVVASLYEVTHKYPEVWHKGWSIERCISHWKNTILASYQYTNSDSDHIFVSYDHLVKSPQNNLLRICKFLNLDFEDSMVDSREQAANQITLPSEKWKNNVTDQAGKLRQRKFDTLFSPEEKRHITNETSLDAYGKLITLCNL